MKGSSGKRGKNSEGIGKERGRKWGFRNEMKWTSRGSPWWEYFRDMENWSPIPRGRQRLKTIKRGPGRKMWTRGIVNIARVSEYSFYTTWRAWKGVYWNWEAQRTGTAHYPKIS
jgi:hypothetical protein